MRTSEEINNMNDIIKQIVIDKFLNININKHKSTFTNKTIQCIVILKEKKDNKDAIIEYKITNNVIKAYIIDRHYYNVFGASNDFIKLKLTIKLHNFHIFLSSINKKLKNKISEYFDFKNNEIRYKELKYVLDNQLSDIELRKIKLEQINNKK